MRSGQSPRWTLRTKHWPTHCTVLLTGPRTLFGAHCPRATCSQIFIHFKLRLFCFPFSLLPSLPSWTAEGAKVEVPASCLWALLQPTTKNVGAVMPKLRSYTTAKPQSFSDIYSPFPIKLLTSIGKHWFAGYLPHPRGQSSIGIDQHWGRGGEHSSRTGKISFSPH